MQKSSVGFMFEENVLRVDNGISVNALPPFQYSLDCPHLNMTKVEKNRVIRIDTINLGNKITWISPKISLGT